MRPIAIIVELDPLPGHRSELVRRLRADCEETLRDDGCMRMEVLLACDGSDRVILSELWRDAAAIEAHRLKPGHSHSWQEPLLRSKRVLRCELLHE